MPTFDFYAKRMETTVETKPQKTETQKNLVYQQTNKNGNQKFWFLLWFPFWFLLIYWYIVYYSHRNQETKKYYIIK